MPLMNLSSDTAIYSEGEFEGESVFEGDTMLKAEESVGAAILREASSPSLPLATWQPSWWKEVVDSSARFLMRLSHAQSLEQGQDGIVCGRILALPIAPLYCLPTDLLRPKQDDECVFVEREAFIELKELVEDENGLICVSGSRGCGKSTALYYLFCLLSSRPMNRILYIPDCKSMNEDPHLTLMSAFARAFSRDAEILSIFLSCMRPQSYQPFCWADILFSVQYYCFQKGFKFYAILDEFQAMDEAIAGKSTLLPNLLADWSSSDCPTSIIISVHETTEELASISNVHFEMSKFT